MSLSAYRRERRCPDDVHGRVVRCGSTGDDRQRAVTCTIGDPVDPPPEFWFRYRYLPVPSEWSLGTRCGVTRRETNIGLPGRFSTVDKLSGDALTWPADPLRCDGYAARQLPEVWAFRAGMRASTIRSMIRAGGGPYEVVPWPGGIEYHCIIPPDLDIPIAWFVRGTAPTRRYIGRVWASLILVGRVAANEVAQIEDYDKCTVIPGDDWDVTMRSIALGEWAPHLWPACYYPPTDPKPRDFEPSLGLLGWLGATIRVNHDTLSLATINSAATTVQVRAMMPRHASNGWATVDGHRLGALPQPLARGWWYAPNASSRIGGRIDFTFAFDPVTSHFKATTPLPQAEHQSGWSYGGNWSPDPPNGTPVTCGGTDELEEFTEINFSTSPPATHRHFPMVAVL